MDRFDEWRYGRLIDRYSLSSKDSFSSGKRDGAIANTFRIHYLTRLLYHLWGRKFNRWAQFTVGRAAWFILGINPLFLDSSRLVSRLQIVQPRNWPLHCAIGRVSVSFTELSKRMRAQTRTIRGFDASRKKIPRDRYVIVWTADRIYRFRRFD